MEDLAVSFWRDRNVFVSGATGLLGGWVVEELLARGARVVTLVRDWTPDSRLVGEGLIERTCVVRGDLVELDVVTRALNEYEIDSVFHLGAQTIVTTAQRSPLSTFEANIKGTWTLLEACRLNPKLVERVVVASSDKAYGIHDQLPYTEEAALLGSFPYDASKACADTIAMSYFATYGTPVTVTRCANLFGGGDLNWNRIVPGTIRSALRGERPVVRSDGSYVRDYFYVRDAARAYVQLAEQMPGDGIVGEAFNFGIQEPLSVLEVVDRLLEVMDRTELEPDVRNEASAEIPAQYLDCRKARERLAWRPAFSLEEGLQETVGWYRKFLEGGFTR
ncbi:MAG: GDP-mannose 4,6-dehydratase [Myxococcota bacterium]